MNPLLNNAASTMRHQCISGTLHPVPRWFSQFSQFKCALLLSIQLDQPCIEIFQVPLGICFAAVLRSHGFVHNHNHKDQEQGQGQ
jgi:hypothetical protein